MSQISFLQNRTLASLKKEINNIVDSYSNPYDILSELTQNAFDAIVRFIKDNGRTIKEHSISIEIDCPHRLVKVRDTGVGIERSLVHELIAPNGTDKESEIESVGEKGVGLTYAIFSCNHFHISTRYKESYFEGEVKNASMWRQSKSGVEIPTLNVINEESISTTTDTFTEITLTGVDKYYNEEEDLFSLPVELIQYIIRSKTIIGNFRAIFDANSLPNISVSLRYINHSNQSQEYSIPLKYCLPEEFLKSNGSINFDDFISKAATLDDRQKTQKLRGKALVRKGALTKNGREIRFYCMFAASRSVWKDICDYNHLYTESSGNKNYALSSGIYVVTKGMPTGIVIEPPSSFAAGYWSNFFMLIEDDSIVFDLGRKTVPSRTKGTLKEVAKQIFSDFNPYVHYVTSDPAITTTINSTVQQQQKTQCYSELKQLASLNIDAISYKKNPNQQEAAVVAIFHELIGARILKGYESLRTGYKQTYDLWATYRIAEANVGSSVRALAQNGFIELPCVIEFKFKAESILDDLTNDIKFFNDMDLIVCWDYDVEAFAKNQVEVQQIPESEVLFYGSNYKLVWPGSYNLGAASEKPVIVLRQFIEDYIRKQNN